MRRSINGTVILPLDNSNRPSACILLSSAETSLLLAFISSASRVMKMLNTLCPAGRRQ